MRAACHQQACAAQAEDAVVYNTRDAKAMLARAAGARRGTAACAARGQCCFRTRCCERCGVLRAPAGVQRGTRETLVLPRRPLIGPLGAL